MTTRDEALAALTAHREAGNVPRGQPDHTTLQLVADCLNADPPATWNDIGRAVGQAKPNAHRKYMPHLVETRHWTVKTTPVDRAPTRNPNGDAMKFLTNRLRSGDTTTSTYMVTDAPATPITDTARDMTFTPEQVIVYRVGDHFHHLEISGPTVGHEGFNTIRRFKREKDVPDWARRYITAD